MKHKNRNFGKQGLLLLAVLLVLGGCSALQQGGTPAQNASTVADGGSEANELSANEPALNTTEVEIMDFSNESEHVIYLAGGCFWGLEQLMQSIPGVIDAQSGYANGTCEADANYPTVYKGNTGFRETVRVEYDPDQVSLDALLLAY